MFVVGKIMVVNKMLRKYIQVHKKYGLVGASWGAVEAGFAKKICWLTVQLQRKAKIYIGVGVSGATSHILSLSEDHIILQLTMILMLPYKVADYGFVCDVKIFISNIETMFAKLELSLN